MASAKTTKLITPRNFLRLRYIYIYTLYFSIFHSSILHIPCHTMFHTSLQRKRSEPSDSEQDYDDEEEDFKVSKEDPEY